MTQKMSLKELLELLTRLEKSALAALDQVEDSITLSDWHGRYIAPPPRRRHRRNNLHRMAQAKIEA